MSKILPGRQSLPRSDCLCQQSRLIVAAAEEAATMEGNRSDCITTSEQRLPCLPHHAGERGGQMRLVGMFEAQHQWAAGIVIEDGGARLGKRWWSGETIRAVQCHARALIGNTAVGGSAAG